MKVVFAQIVAAGFVKYIDGESYVRFRVAKNWLEIERCVQCTFVLNVNKVDDPL